MSTDPWREPPSIFDNLVVVGRRPSPPKAPKLITRGACPLCTNDGVGLTLDPLKHLIWRPHRRAIGKSGAVPCAGGGVRLCDLPAREAPRIRITPHCTH